MQSAVLRVEYEPREKRPLRSLFVSEASSLFGRLRLSGASRVHLFRHAG